MDEPQIQYAELAFRKNINTADAAAGHRKQFGHMRQDTGRQKAMEGYVNQSYSKTTRYISRRIPTSTQEFEELSVACQTDPEPPQKHKPKRLKLFILSAAAVLVCIGTAANIGIYMKHVKKLYYCDFEADYSVLDSLYTKSNCSGVPLKFTRSKPLPNKQSKCFAKEISRLQLDFAKINNICTVNIDYTGSTMPSINVTTIKKKSNGVDKFHCSQSDLHQQTTSGQVSYDCHHQPTENIVLEPAAYTCQIEVIGNIAKA